MQIHQLAVELCCQRLHAGGRDAHRATALLEQRQVDLAAARQAGLGYAAPGWTELTDQLRAAGFSDDELLASGISQRSARGTLIDRFRDRIVFPVRDATGRPLGLLGRTVIPAGTDRTGAPIPKYLNSPDTALYRKGDVLYTARDAATALAAGVVPVLVEGPMDALAVDRAGSRGREAGRTDQTPATSFIGVAPCGTALTAAQVQLLDRAAGGLHTRPVLVAFDSDAAGLAGALRAYKLLRGVGAWPHAVQLPAGQDPAGLLQQHGPAALRAALTSAAHRPLADLVVDERLDRYADQWRWAEGRLCAARAAAVVVAGMPPEHVARQVVRLANRLELPADEVTGLALEALGSMSWPPSRSDAAAPPSSLLAGAGTSPGSPRGAARLALAAFPVPGATALRPPELQPDRPGAPAESPPAPQTAINSSRRAG